MNYYYCNYLILLLLVIGHEGAIARKLEFKSRATLVIGQKEGTYLYFLFFIYA